MSEESETPSPVAIYEGTIRHRRFAPKRHDFRYRLFMTYADLDALDAWLDEMPLASADDRGWKPALIRYRRADYFGDAGISLAEAVRREVETQTGTRPTGPVRMLGHLRQWGVGFNPATFYYCWSSDETEVEAIVVEVTNTPWGERHLYVLSDPRDDRATVRTYEHEKAFHVSPFMPMEQRYRWRFTTSARRLVIHIDNLEGANVEADDRSTSKIFDATLDLGYRAPLRWRSLLGAQCRHPMLPAMVLFRIYRQAARLWLRRIPFHPHPASGAPGPGGTLERP